MGADHYSWPPNGQLFPLSGRHHLFGPSYHVKDLSVNPPFLDSAPNFEMSNPQHMSPSPLLPLDAVSRGVFRTGDAHGADDG